MYNVSQSFLTAIKQQVGREFKGTVLIRDAAFDDNNIISLNLDENCNPSDSFMLGSVGSSKLEVTLVNLPTSLILDGAQVKPSIGLNVGGSFEDVPLGVFWVDDISIDKGTIKLSCYDNMIKLEKAYFSDLIYPASINSVAQEICTKAGLELASTLPNTLINKIEGYTCREAVSFIASFLGGFARFNRLGKLEINTYKSTGFAVDGNNYSEFKSAESPFALGRLACKVGDKILTTGSTGNEIQFENPIMTQTQLDSIYNTLKNLSYMPYTMNYQGNPALQAGDKISITDLDDNTYNTLVMQHKIEYSGGLGGSASAVGKTQAAQEFSSSGTMKNTIDRMVIEQANIKVLMAEKASINYLEANYAHITNGVIDNAKIDYAAINNLAANIATIADGRIATAKIGAAQISSVDVACLNAGTIDTARISLAGPNSRLVIQGNRLQVFANMPDNSLYERISVGDVNGDGSNYGLKVRGADGTTTLFDENGVTKQGFTDGYNKLDNDSLDPAKIDIKKVVTRINNGTTTIQGSKVFLNNSTLDVQFSSLSTTVNNIQVGGRNLLIDKTIVKGYFIDASGNLLTNSISITSDFIPVINNKQYVITNNNSDYMKRIAYYDINKVFIKRDLVYAPESTIITTPSNCAYIRFGTDNYVKEKCKIEIGNKVTDWTPAPEDVQTQIDSNYAKITATATAIGFDLTSQTFTDTGLNQRLTATETFIQINKDKITAAVSQTDINSSIGAIQVGGRNLLLKTGFDQGVYAGFFQYFVGSPTGTFSIIDEPTALSKKAMQFTLTSSPTGAGGVYISFKNNTGYSFTVGKTYTASGYVKQNKATNSFNIAYEDINPTKTISLAANTWTYFEYTFTVATIDKAFHLYDMASPYHVSGDTFAFHSIKIETGNKATTWSPAPEDVQRQIDNAVTRISSAEFKITSDSIVSTVSKSIMSSSNISVLVDDTDSSIIYTGNWTKESGTSYYNSTYTIGNTLNDTIQYSFVGTGINVYDCSFYNRGIVQIYIDGVSKGTIDCYSSAAVYKRKAYSITNLPYGMHTIKIVNTHTKNASATDYYFTLDYFEVLNSTAVSSTNIISQINQSAEQIKIAANKITIDGSAIDISANASITSKVSINDFGTMIAQNQSSVRIAVGQIGGNNLIKNGAFNFGFAGWDTWDNGRQTYGITQVSGNESYCLTNFSYTGGYGLKTPFISLIQGQKYTLSFDASSYYFVDRLDYMYLLSTSNGNVALATITIDGTTTNFKRYSLTFAAPFTASDVRILIGSYTSEASSGRGFRIKKVKLEEGENATAWSPNANELKAASFEVTDSYARFTSKSGNYTEFNPDDTGLKWHSSDGNKVRDYHYLAEVGSGLVMSGLEDITINLPSEFKNKKFKAIVMLSKMVGQTNYEALNSVWLFVPENSIDYINATFVISVNAMCINVETKEFLRRTCGFSWLAIA